MPSRPNKKQAQRTKGNVRPSNSSQAAQLLNDSGASTQGFIGFGCTTTDMGYVPIVDVDHTADMSLDPDLRLVLRKLSKKDSITKIKALQEFNTLMKDKDCKDAKAVLPYWPRIYSKISMDDNHKVREAGQQSMAVLAKSLHRELAPHLKKLMASWLLGMCDPYPTVATAAQHAFNSAFPTAKQAQALSFCQDAILDFTVDNLLHQRPETIGDPKLLSPDELTTKYHRVLSSSLLSICKLLKSFPEKSDKISKEKVSKLLESPKFWKLPKSPIKSIRSSSFLLLSTVCQVLPGLATENLPRLSPCVLLSLDESDTTVSGCVWEAVLSLCNTSSECWQHVNVQKAVWPKFRNVLTEGCYGNAVGICPSILPLLSKFPKTFYGEPLRFYEQFFTCFKTGICKDSVQRSVSECSAMVGALMECIQYMVKVDLDSDQLNACSSVFSNQLEALLLESLIEPRRTLSKCTLYGEVGTFLDSLTDRSVDAEHTSPQRDKPPSDDDSKSSSVACWAAITDISLKCIEMLNSDTSSSLNYLPERLVQLAENLLCPKKPQPNATSRASNLSVKFSSSSSDLSASDRSASMIARSSTAALSHSQQQYISQLICKSFSLVDDSLKEWHVYLFVRYLRLYPAAHILKQLVPDKLDPQDGDKDGDIYQHFATDVLLRWLTKMQSCSMHQESQQSDVYVFNAIFMLLPLFNDADCIISFLDHLCHNLYHDRRSLRVFLLELLSSRRRVSAVSKWLETPTLGELIVSITEDVCSRAVVPPVPEGVPLSTDEISWSLLSVALSSNSQSEPLLLMKFVEKIFSVIHSTLLKLKSSRDNRKTELSMQFVSKVLASFFQGIEDCSLTNSAEDLILILYKFVLEGESCVTEATLKDVRQVCLSGMCTLHRRLAETSKHRSHSSFFLNVFQAVRDTVVCKVTTAEQLQNVFEEVKTLVNTVFRTGDDGMTNAFLPDHLTPLFPVTAHVLPPTQFEEYLMITGQLNATYWDCKRLGKTPPSAAPVFDVPLPGGGSGCGAAAVAVAPAVAPRFPDSAVFLGLFQTYLLDFLRDTSQDKESAATTTTTTTTTTNTTTTDAAAAAATTEVVAAATAAAVATDHTTCMLDHSLYLSVLYDLVCCVGVAERWVDTYQQSTPAELRRCMVTLHKQLHKQLTATTAEALLEHFIQQQRVLSGGHWRALGLQFLLEQYFHEKLSEDRIGCYFEEEFSEQHVQMLWMLIQNCTSAACWSITQVLVTKILSLPSEDPLTLTSAAGLLPLVTIATGKWKFHEDPDKQDIFIELLTSLSEWRQSSGEFYLFHRNVNFATPQAVLFNVEVMAFLKLMWVQLPSLDNDASDFILCSAVSWLQSASETKDTGGLSVQVFLVGLCKLLCEMCRSVQQSSTAAQLPSNVVSEWNEFFSEAVYTLLLPLYIHAAESVVSSEKDVYIQHPVVAWLGQVLVYCPTDRLLNTPLREADSASQSPSERLKDILRQFCPMLLSKVYAIQVTAYHVLYKIVADLHYLDSQESSSPMPDCVEKFKKLSTRVEDKCKSAEQLTIKQYCSQFDGEEDDSSGRQPNEALMQVLLQSWDALESHMDGAAMEKLPAPSHCTLGYLLTWKLQLHFIKTATSELRAEYLRYFHTLGLIDIFLSDIFSLIPESLVSSYQPRKDEGLNLTSAFKRVLLCTAVPACDKLLQDVACMLYEEALETIPAVIRTWWLKQNRSFASFIDNFTKQFISPVLCKKEISNLLNMEMKLANISVRARPLSREIVAVYTLDDVSIEMVISLPENYPLGTISVHCDQRKGISSNISKKWLLQLNIFLQHQNGNIMDGLSLWKRYIDKKFEGVEECTICYCVVHGTDYHLPQKQCKTCHKKFHSICLYKWFQESQNSSCPLCRTAFSLPRH